MRNARKIIKRKVLRSIHTKVSGSNRFLWSCSNQNTHIFLLHLGVPRRRRHFELASVDHHSATVIVDFSTTQSLIRYVILGSCISHLTTYRKRKKNCNVLPIQGSKYFQAVSRFPFKRFKMGPELRHSK